MDVLQSYFKRINRTPRVRIGLKGLMVAYLFNTLDTEPKTECDFIMNDTSKDASVTEALLTLFVLKAK